MRSQSTDSQQRSSTGVESKHAPLLAAEEQRHYHRRGVRQLLRAKAAHVRLDGGTRSKAARSSAARSTVVCALDGGALDGGAAALDGGVLDGGALDCGTLDGGARFFGTLGGGTLTFDRSRETCSRAGVWSTAARSARHAHDGGALDGGALDGSTLDGGTLDGGALDGGTLNGGALNGDASSTATHAQRRHAQASTAALLQTDGVLQLLHRAASNHRRYSTPP